MKVIKSMKVMLPQGELYGFPKTFTPAKDGDFLRWLVDNEYPVHLINANAKVRTSDIVYQTVRAGPIDDEEAAL